MEWFTTLLDKLPIDRFAVQIGVVLFVIAFAIFQFLRWQQAARKSKNRRNRRPRSRHLIDASDYVARLNPTQQRKEYEMDMTPDDSEQLVKLEDAMRSKDQKISALQQELEARVNTISALEKDIENWHQDWTGLEEQIKNQPATAPSTPAPAASESLIKAPVAANDDDELADYIATWVTQTSKSTELSGSHVERDSIAEAEAEQPSKVSTKITPTQDPALTDSQRFFAEKLVADADSSDNRKEDSALLSDKEMLGLADTGVLDPSDTIIALQEELLDKQRTIDQMEAAERLPGREFEEKIKQREVKISELELALKTKSDLAENLRQNVDQLREYRSMAAERGEIIARLQSELQSHTDNSSHLEKDVDNWQTRYKTLEKQTQERASAVQELKKQLVERQEQVNSLESELQDFWERWPQMETKVEESQKERMRLRGVIDQQNKDMEALKESLLESQKTLNDKLASSSVVITESTQKVAELEAKLSDKEKSLQTKHAEHIKKLEAKHATREQGLIATHEKQLKQLQAQLESKDQESATMQMKLLEIDAEMASNTTTSKDVDNKIKKLEADIAERDDRIENMQTHISARDSKLEALNTQLSAKENHNKQILNLLQQKDAELETLRVEIEERTAPNEEIQGIVDEQSQKIQELTSALEDKQASIERLTDKLNSAKSDLNEAKEELATSGDESHTVTQIISTLGATVGVDPATDDWRQGVSEINDKLKGSKKEIDGLRDQLGLLRDIEVTANIQDEAIMDMQRDLKKRDGRIQELEAQLRKWESQWQTFEDTIATDQGGPANFQKANDQARKLQKDAVNTLKRDIADANSSIQEIETALSDIRPGRTESSEAPAQVPMLKRLIRRGSKNTKKT